MPGRRCLPTLEYTPPANQALRGGVGLMVCFCLLASRSRRDPLSDHLQLLTVRDVR